MRTVQHKPPAQWCISYTTCLHSPRNVRCVVTTKTQHNLSSRFVRPKMSESSFHPNGLNLGKGRFRHVRFDGGTRSLEMLGQFLANFSVLTDCDELHRVLLFLPQPIKNRSDMQLNTT